MPRLEKTLWRGAVHLQGPEGSSPRRLRRHGSEEEPVPRVVLKRVPRGCLLDRGGKPVAARENWVVPCLGNQNRHGHWGQMDTVPTDVRGHNLTYGAAHLGLHNLHLQTNTKWETVFFFFWPCPQHVKVLGPGIEPAPHQQPEPQKWQHQILNLLSHRGTPWATF